MQHRPAEHWSSKALVAAAILALLASPLILLGIAMAEQALCGSSYATDFYAMIGIRGAIQSLYEWLFPYP